jgi:23S rRNA pseudouridine1911/1915/1917 synthase
MPASFLVEADESGQTLSAVLRRHLGELPWSRARQLCERGKVRVDGEVTTDPTRRMRAGTEVSVDEAAPRPAPPVAVAGRIAWEDAHVVVLDKPSGVSSVPYEKRESGTAMDLVRALWRAEGRRATVTPLHVVHRIDKETSGLLAFAKTKLAERGLEALFRAHDVERTYLCVAHGRVSDRRIESRLVTDRGDGLRGSTRVPNQGKRAVTHVRAVEHLRDATLCEVRLETGKTHQIRIHLAEDGHPLVGEKVYIRDWLKHEREPLLASRLLLHAATLGFVHPVTRKQVRLESPLPPEFVAALEKLR